jgi:hypothetical protein
MSEHRGCVWHHRWLELVNVAGKMMVMQDDRGEPLAGLMADIELLIPHPEEREPECEPGCGYGGKLCPACVEA